jgi:hypothetical protein
VARGPTPARRRLVSLALSEVEGLALSEVEGLALSEVEGLRSFAGPQALMPPAPMAAITS